MTTMHDTDSEILRQAAGEPGTLLSGQSILGEPEPWEAWETSLCLWSIGIGIAGLVILGVLVNLFLLPG
jgi:hypothetical protein